MLPFIDHFYRFSSYFVFHVAFISSISFILMLGAVCSNLAWLTIWPLDVVKSQVRTQLLLSPLFIIILYVCWCVCIMYLVWREWVCVSLNAHLLWERDHLLCDHYLIQLLYKTGHDVRNMMWSKTIRNSLKWRLLHHFSSNHFYEYESAAIWKLRW